MVDTSGVEVVAPLCALTTNVLAKISAYLDARELCRIAVVCKRLKTVGESRPLNAVWWKLCMQKWYNPENVPKVMLNKKCDWRKMYFESGFPDDSVRKESVMDQPTRKQLLEQQRAEARRVEEEAASQPTKAEMRAYYKQYLFFPF
eukprot:Phypoly_transcript_17201.p1 GENE.Phypoly_transcript_17201~~Phypoly_transcript_17201.p1  ORF type:complete len:146 (+),score=25.21 Phypoly_transcript_17201:111-548(+)